MCVADISARSRDEQDDEDSIDGLTAGMSEVGVRKERAREEGKLITTSLPLRKAAVALSGSFDTAVEKHWDALTYIDGKVKRAEDQGLFSTKFMFSDVEGLSSASHAQYVGFIQLLTVLGYSCAYSNGDENLPPAQHKKTFEPSTTITMSWMPQKKA